MRTIKAKSKNLDWQDIQQMQQQKNEHKAFRDKRKNRKDAWQIAE